MPRKKTQEPTSFEQNAEEVMRSAEGVCGLLRLSDFVENPDNPSTATDEAFDRLVGKLRRVPDGLTAQRIAYVTDRGTPFIVLSGNKRLRALKRIYGSDASVSADWFQDITSMSEDQRREFVVTANINEGKWVADMLLAIVPIDELKKLMSDQDVEGVLADIPNEQRIAENEELDADGFSDNMKLKLSVTKDDADLADRVLGEDRAAAFMKIVRGEK